MRATVSLGKLARKINAQKARQNAVTLKRLEEEKYQHLAKIPRTAADFCAEGPQLHQGFKGLRSVTL
jgi:hypothetical protein